MFRSSMALFVVAVGVAACRSETQTPEPVCAPVEFRACDAGRSCRGVQQCLASGSGYGACNCVVLDSGFPLTDAGGGGGGGRDAASGGQNAAGTAGSSGTSH